MESIEKSIVKTSLITLGILVASALIFVLIMSIFFPQNMYRFCDSLGFNKLSYTYAERQYQKSNDINDLHTLIYSAHKIQNDDAIIKYTEILMQSPNYDDFIKYINDLNMSSTNIVMAQVVMSNENNFLKNKYVVALCNAGEFTKACEFTLEEIYSYQDWSLPNCTEWLLSPLLEYQNRQATPDYTFLKDTKKDGHSMLYLFEKYLDRVLDAYDTLKADPSMSANGEFLIQVLKYDLSSYLNHILFLNGKVDLEVHNFNYYQDARNAL